MLPGPIKFRLSLYNLSKSTFSRYSSKYDILRVGKAREFLRLLRSTMKLYRFRKTVYAEEMEENGAKEHEMP